MCWNEIAPIFDTILIHRKNLFPLLFNLCSVTAPTKSMEEVMLCQFLSSL